MDVIWLVAGIILSKLLLRPQVLSDGTPGWVSLINLKGPVVVTAIGNFRVLRVESLMSLQ